MAGKITLTVLCLVGLFVCPISAQNESWKEKAFPGKLIFSETPFIGQKWHGGIRMNDILIWDGYLNVGGWLMLDYLRAGIGNLTAGESEISDKFGVFTIKSCPWSSKIMNKFYAVSAGIKIYRSTFYLLNKDGQELDTALQSNDASTVLFITQGYDFKPRHYAGLFTSLSFRKEGAATYFIIPQYRYDISAKWHVSLEYLITNTRFIPIKILQYGFKDTGLDFDNLNRDAYSFMFYGFQYTGKHFRADLGLANHPTFGGPIFPMLGAGWNF